MRDIVTSIDNIIIPKPLECSVELNKECSIYNNSIIQQTTSSIIISGKTSNNRKFTYTIKVHGKFSSELVVEKSEEEKLDSLLKEVTE